MDLCIDLPLSFLQMLESHVDAQVLGKVEATLRFPASDARILAKRDASEW
jgi:hypothetical protein